MQEARQQLTVRVITNICFFIPYIVILIMGDNAPTWLVIPVFVWGFIGFRWLMDTFFRLTGIVLFMSLQSGCFTYLMGSILCSIFGVFVIPIHIIADIIRLVNLQESL